MKNVEKNDVGLPVNGIVKIYKNKDLKEAVHSEDIQEIITKVPSWIIRWGIMLFIGILLIIVAISILVRYPDTIKLGLKIESVNNSKSVITPGAGTISKTLVKKAQFVKTGQPLVYLNDASVAGHTIILTAPQDGQIAFVAIMQDGYYLKDHQEVLRIIPQNEDFFGIAQAPQNQINKIKEGQSVIIKLNNYPAEEYGFVTGKISYITDEPSKEGFFAVKITFDHKDAASPIKLKNWMVGTAEIMTKDVSLLSHIYNSIVKGLK